jgi:drug/metabolite transporter (DMT)-like permease
MLNNSNRLSKGYLAASFVLLIGVGWQLATRYGVTTTLNPVDLALFRYGVPGLILLPVAIKKGVWPKDVPAHLLIAIILGAGLPFGLMSISGSFFAPAAHMGVILPGSITLLVGFFSLVAYRASFSIYRLAGLTLIFFGFVVFGFSISSGFETSMLKGHALFFLAACLWVTYTFAFRRSGLTPLHATAVIGFWSLIAILPIWLLSPSAKLLTAPPMDVAFQFLFQGILAGVIAVVLYGVAVQNIGAVTTTAIGALLPTLVAFGGVVFLKEAISFGVFISASLTALGVFLLSGWLDEKKFKNRDK